MAEPIYAAQDSPQQAVSPMEELAGLRGRHEGLMKEHAYLRDKLAGRLRESNARLESENREMNVMLQYLRDLHPATGDGNVPPDQVAVIAARVQQDIEMAHRRSSFGH